MTEMVEVVILNFDCQWCGQPFRARSREVVPCPFCKSEHGPEDGYVGPSEWEDEVDPDDPWQQYLDRYYG